MKLVFRLLMFQHLCYLFFQHIDTRTLGSSLVRSLFPSLSFTSCRSEHRVTVSHPQEAVINELKTKSQTVGEKKLLHQDDVYNGALEDILHGLRSEPYRRADAVRRSHRRRINSHRLSRGLEELDVWYEDSSETESLEPKNIKKRKDLEMVPKKPISVYKDDERKAKASMYKVAPSDCEVEERCELIKSTYDVISKYTRAMFDSSETVVWMCLIYIDLYVPMSICSEATRIGCHVSKWRF